MEGQRNKGPETTGLILLSPQSQEVLDPFFAGFYVAEQERGVGSYSQPMGLGMNSEPFTSTDL
jgi:hypothetical protein